MKIGFIGLGIMGSRMAANLLKNNVNIIAYNRTQSKADDLVALGAERADSAIEVAQKADVVFTMLATPEVVEEVAFGESGFVKAMPKGNLWIDSSTVDPSFSRRMGTLAIESGVRFMDIPVAGSKNQAAEAQLVFIAGGEKADLERIEPYLNMMGKKVLHTGNVGMGSSLKILVNSMLAQSMIVFSETVFLGQKLGIEKEFLLNFLPELPVIAPFVKAKIGKIKSGDYDVEFPLELIQKDLHLVSLAAYEHQIPQYLANLSKDIYAAANQKGLGREDFSAVFAYLNG